MDIPKLWSFAQLTFCCRDVGLNGQRPNTELGWTFATRIVRCNFNIVASGKTMSRMAPLSKHDNFSMLASIELDRCATVHEMSNQQSLKQSFPNTNLDAPLAKLFFTYNFAASPFLRYMISTQDHFLDPENWRLSPSCDPFAAAFCCKDVGPNEPNNKHSLKEHLSRTLAVQLQQRHPCEWQDYD